MRLIQLLVVVIVLTGLTACRSPESSRSSTPTGDAISLKDQQLLDIIEAEKELDARAAEPDVDSSEVQRLFYLVDQMYASFFSRNPEDLNSRLLYGKLLMRYNDLEGARTQFLVAAKLAERTGEPVAVIHQQLATIAAEQGDFSRALVFADNAVKYEPEVADYHYGLGQILLAFRRELIAEEIFDEASIDRKIQQSFTDAINLEPATLPQLYVDGLACYDLQDPDYAGALALWNTLAQHPGTSAQQRDAVSVHQVRCLVQLGRLQEARDIANAIQDPELGNSANALF